MSIFVRFAGLDMLREANRSRLSVAQGSPKHAIVHCNNNNNNIRKN